jgi:hypothetical protein
MRERRLVGVSLASGVLLLMVLTFWGPWASAQDFQGNQTTQAGGGPEFSQAPGAPEAQGTPGAAEGQQPSDPNTEVLTKGAIHEAFAQPVVFNSAPGPVVAQKPPEPVDEMPPEQKPAGDHVAWIPGYWSWEGDQNKYIWTSGIWRSIPAGVEWVPGYWQQVDTGSQFVSGYWRKTAEQEVTYMPQKPPDTLETGPVGAAPSANVVWIPGCWVWRGSHYAWRAGFWAPCNPDWIWIPAHYVWTPSGYLFVEGHWDYAMQNRGVFFAPVVFRPGIVWGAGYVYSPAIAMDFGACQGCMFCGPCGYCFGNYYGPAFVGVGIYPWFEWHHRYGYDPCFAYCSWHYGPGWRERCVVDYRFRIGHPEARPPVTFALMVRGGGWGGPALALHINVLAARGGGMRFERLAAARRAEIHRAVREQHVANERRAAEERRNAGHSAPFKSAAPHSALQANARAAAERNAAAGGRSTSAARTTTQNSRQQPQQKKAPPKPAARGRTPQAGGSSSNDRR